MRLLFALLLILAPVTAAAQTQTTPYRDSSGQVRESTATVLLNPDGTPASVGGVVCAATSGTLTANGQTVTLTCNNAGAFAITVTPNSFVGTLSFTSASGSPKRLNRNGQAPLQVSSLTYRATDTGPRYYAANGGNALVVTASGVTGGSIAVSISATAGVLYPIPIGEYQTSALVGLLNGRSFTAGFPGGTLNVTNDNLACLTVANPANSGVRGIYESRQMSTDVLGSQQPVRFYVVNNATAGLPTTAATVNNRGAGGTSAMTVTYGSLAALPTGGATALGGYVPTGGVTYSPPLEKTIEPGTNQTMCVIGKNATGGVGVTSSPSIIFGWREQAVN